MPDDARAIAQMIPLDRLMPSPLNPRTAVDSEAVQALAASIASIGLLHPPVVRPFGVASEGRFEIVAGARRVAALKALADAGTWPADRHVLCTVREISDHDLLKLAVAENVGRAELTPMEEARAFRRLLELGSTTASIAADIGKSQRHVQLRLDLLERLHPTAQVALEAGLIDTAKARALTLAPVAKQEALLKKAQPDEHGSVAYRTAEDVARHARSKQVPVSVALFDLADYTGEIVTDADDPKHRWFADTAQFTKLQNAALKELETTLREKWPWVETVRQRHYYLGSEGVRVPHGYERGTKNAGAVILIDSENIKKPRAITGLVKRETGMFAEPAPTKLTAADKAAAEADDKFRLWCRTFKTMALQRYVLARPGIARVILLVMLVEGEAPCEADTLDLAVTKALAATGALLLTDPADMARLAKLSDRAVGDALTAHVAARMELRVWRSPDRWGDDPADVETLRPLGFDPLAGWSMDAAFLAACPAPVVERIIKDLGVLSVQPHAFAASILAAPGAKTYRPPWLELATEGELAAMLKAKPAAAPAAAKPAEKAKPAAKPKAAKPKASKAKGKKR